MQSHLVCLRSDQQDMFIVQQRNLAAQQARQRIPNVIANRYDQAARSASITSRWGKAPEAAIGSQLIDKETISPGAGRGIHRQVYVNVGSYRSA